MGMALSNIAVGVFREPAQARKAIEELRQAGYSDEEIGYLARASAMEPDQADGTSITNSAIEGGLLGGLVGAAVALLVPGFGLAIAGGVLAASLGGAALGAAAGGILGTLLNIGISEEEARHYQKALEAGHTVITVKAESGYTDALRILRQNGAYDVAIRYSEVNATPPLRPYGSSEPEESGEVSERRGL